MLPKHLRGYLRAQRLAWTLLGGAATLLLSVIANRITPGRLAVPALLGVVVLLGAVAVALLWRRPPPDLHVRWDNPEPLNTDGRRAAGARRGVIAFVPLYSPQAGSPAAGLSAEGRQAAAARLDYSLLDPEHSNLAPTIQGIAAHKDRLEHCWLVSTRGDTSDGSLPYAGVLAAYLKDIKQLTCRFHFDAPPVESQAKPGPYTLELQEDTQVVQDTYRLIQKLFREATDQDLADTDVVADISTGFRSMTLGMVLACLDRRRCVQFVGTSYTPLGVPGKDLTPIVYGFEPELPPD